MEVNFKFNKIVMKNTVSFILCFFIISVTFSQTWTQLGSDINGEYINDRAGQSVSISSDGTTVAIGSPSQNNAQGNGIGYVRVYTWNGSNWIKKGATINGEIGFIGFGLSVSINSDGTNLIAGAVDYGIYKGQARVFFWNGTAWIQKGSSISGDVFNDRLGYAVSINSDGNTIATGAPWNIGKAKVFSWDGNAWIQKGVDIVGNYDLTGYAVSLSADGNDIVIDGKWASSGGINAFGQVRAYNWNGNAWIQKGVNILGDPSYANNGYGISMSSDASTIAIGSPFYYSTANRGGLVSVYSWIGNSWIQKGASLPGEVLGGSDYTGYAVNLSSDGNTLAIGAPANEDNGSSAGSTRVYHWNGSNWIQKGLDIDGAINSSSGHVVGISSDGNRVIIGSPSPNTNTTGFARVYEYTAVNDVAEYNKMEEEIYPNPGQGIITIKLLKPAFMLEIMDVAGKQIRRNSVLTTEHHISLDVFSLDPGIYFAKIYYKNENKILKFIKN